jgi:hypothetical protein
MMAVLALLTIIVGALISEYAGRRAGKEKSHVRRLRIVRKVH